MTLRQQTTPEALRGIPDDLYDEDQRQLAAIRADVRTRGQAKAIFAADRGVSLTEVRVRKGAYRRNLDYEREQAEDGIPEPYDGWPVFECGPGEDGIEFWISDPDE